MWLCENALQFFNCRRAFHVDDDQRFVVAGFGGMEGIVAVEDVSPRLALRFQLVKSVIQMASAQGNLLVDGLARIGLHQPLYPVALCVRGSERQAAE